EAEEMRDFREIYSYYSPDMRRYWDNYNPSYSELKELYERNWKVSSLASNQVVSIKKNNENVYDLHTVYSFFDNKNREYKKVSSIVKFVFGDDGKIDQMYGIHTSRINDEYDHSKKTYSRNYLYKALVTNPGFPPPLRAEPTVNGRVLYEIPMESTIYVIQERGEGYSSVYVDGHTGYLSKGLIKRN